jgi:isopenicillin N synthase-like dioxygenase
MHRRDPPLPVFDLRKLDTPGEGSCADIERLGRVCSEWGTFYLRHHGIEEDTIGALEKLSREFFSWQLERKLGLRMELGGRAWRGYFPPGGELTSGQPDDKEGLYFGTELKEDHPLVVAKTPLHGRNLFPDLEGFSARVLAHMNALVEVGQRLLRAIARSLGLPEQTFEERFTADPLVLFRIFYYPVATGDAEWGVGAHSDYGLLTLLWQDSSGGLQVRAKDGRWIDVPPVPNALVCNLGDMMERITGGRFHSITHRVVGQRDRSRIAMPLFLDPNYHAKLAPFRDLMRVTENVGERSARLDGASVHAFEGTYGEYLLQKVGRVFPALRDVVLD